MGEPTNIKRRRERDDVDVTPKEKYRRLYLAVIDNPMSHISSRFSTLKKITFFDLINKKHFDTFSKSGSFPDHLLVELSKSYPKFFDCQGLKNKLLVFYKTVNFHKTPVKQRPWLFFLQIIQIGKTNLYNPGNNSLSQVQFFSTQTHPHSQEINTDRRSFEPPRYSVHWKGDIVEVERKIWILQHHNREVRPKIKEDGLPIQVKVGLIHLTINFFNQFFWINLCIVIAWIVSYSFHLSSN